MADNILDLNNPELIKALRDKTLKEEAQKRAAQLGLSGYTTDRQSFGDQANEGMNVIEKYNLLKPTYDDAAIANALEAVKAGTKENEVDYGNLMIGAGLGGLGHSIARAIDDSGYQYGFDTNKFIEDAVKEKKAENRKPYDTALSLLEKARQERKDTAATVLGFTKAAEDKPIRDWMMYYQTLKEIQDKKNEKSQNKMDVTAYLDSVGEGALDALDKSTILANKEDYLKDNPEAVLTLIQNSLSSGRVPSSGIKGGVTKEGSLVEGVPMKITPTALQENINPNTAMQILDKLYKTYGIDMPLEFKNKKGLTKVKQSGTSTSGTTDEFSNFKRK